MKIQKIGHCCLVIKTQGKTVMTDPGVYTEAQNSLLGIDIVLITHEHRDHLHIDSLKAVIKNNPKALVVTNSAVGKLLDAQNINYQVLENGQSCTIDKLSMESFGNTHAEIYKTIPRIQNTGYMISGRLCYPGDAFEKPKNQPEIIALPVVGPWMKIGEAVDYAIELKPKFVFPVHDAFLKFSGPFYAMPKSQLEPYGIKFVIPEESQEMEF